MKTPYCTEEQVLEAIDRHNGRVYEACQTLGIAPSTFTDYKKRYPSVRARVEFWRGHAIDRAENALAGAVERAEPWAVQLTLKGIGKNRGHSERVELTGPDGGPMEVDVATSPLAEYADVINRINEQSEMKELPAPSDFRSENTPRGDNADASS